MRHAQVNIDHRIMLEGMRADFTEVDRINAGMDHGERGDGDSRDESGHGDCRGGLAGLEVAEDRRNRHPAKWGNLQGRRLSPVRRVDGTFVVGGIVELPLRSTATLLGLMTVRVVDGRLVEAQCADKALEGSSGSTATGPQNSDRCGQSLQLALVLTVRGCDWQYTARREDLSIHNIAFGNHSAHAGADWCSVEPHRCGRAEVRHLDRPADYAAEFFFLIPSHRQRFNDRPPHSRTISLSLLQAQVGGPLLGSAIW